MSNLAAAMPFATLLGIETTEAGPDQVIGTMTIRPDMCTAGEIAHGGSLMAFADSLAAIGGYLNKPDGAGGTTTVESKSNFVGRAPVGTKLTATATPISVGKRLSVWQTKVVTEDEKLVAMVTQTQMVI